MSSRTNKFGRRTEANDRPQEMSSKIQPSSHYHGKKVRKETPTSHQKRIDPRFSQSYGEFNRQAFDQNYKFLRKIKKKERKTLMNELANPEISTEERKKIKLLLQRMDNQNKEKAKLKKKSEVDQIEREYQIKELVQGRQPRYYKKSEKKLFDLISQFEGLKEKGGLIRHIKRRRKKLTQKDCKHFDFLNPSR